MKTFIYFSQGEWRTFQAEELLTKPERSYIDFYNHPEIYDRKSYESKLIKYESKIAALKAKSLKVGNTEAIYHSLEIIVQYDEGGVPEENQFIEWPGTVEIIEHTPLGCETWADVEFVAILLVR